MYYKFEVHGMRHAASLFQPRLGIKIEKPLACHTLVTGSEN
jgi:hypothetical protein